MSNSIAQIGKSLRARRLATGLSIDNLSLVSGVGPTTIQRIESGRDTTIGTLKKLLCSLDMDFELRVDGAGEILTTYTVIIDGDIETHVDATDASHAVRAIMNELRDDMGHRSFIASFGHQFTATCDGKSFVGRAQYEIEEVQP